MSIDKLNNILASYYEPVRKSIIGNDIMFIRNVTALPCFEYPIKPGVVVSVHCFSGSADVSVNMKHWTLGKNQSLTVQPDNMMQFHSVSDNFVALVIFISVKLFDDFELDAKIKANTFIYLRNIPIRQLKKVDIDLMNNYYSMLEHVAGMNDNSYKLHIIKLLLLAYFYIFANPEHIRNFVETVHSRTEQYFEAFHDLLLIHYRESRDVKFYAEKMCLNAKYLSSLIKQITKKTASEWIDGYLMLEAKSLLKLKGATIQEISNYLGFPDQSTFGKYFKRHAGVSPKGYILRHSD
ncbi:MAG: AraC family transcriptional regulator [Tannerella sp.]|jgi:AraC-like DNA-binding protein|nr:AraC family transcriptional regulator [Tannerella sp.]